MTDHPPWCAGPPVCTAEPEPGVPFSEGEHRSARISLPTGQIFGMLRSGPVTAYLTQRPALWHTHVHLHIAGDGVDLAQMPVNAYRDLADVLDDLVAQVPAADGGDPAPARPRVHARWPSAQPGDSNA